MTDLGDSRLRTLAVASRPGAWVVAIAATAYATAGTPAAGLVALAVSLAIVRPSGRAAAGGAVALVVVALLSVWREGADATLASNLTLATIALVGYAAVVAGRAGPRPKR
jgi:hypothetical protein